MHQNVRTFKFPYIDHEKENIIENGLFDYLKNLGKEKNYQTLSYVLKEIIGNASKANLKRIHFNLNKLDIKKESEYKTGINSFKDAISLDTEKYCSLAEQLGYFVKVDFYIENFSLIMSVLNNTPILPSEIKRIQDKFRKAISVKNIEEIVEHELDFSEGGGLGIIVIMLLVRKLGLDEKVFKILRSNEYTQVKINVPLSALDLDEEEFVADIVALEIENIPQLPQHVLMLQKILSNPNSEFSDIAHLIQQDPSMISDLLKVANSAIYALPKKVNNIEEAVKLIGFKGVKNLVLGYATRKILMNQYKLSVIEEIMNHSAEVAFYANELVRYLKLKLPNDSIYVAAILHDIGKIIIQAISPEITEKVQQLCAERAMTIAVAEGLTDGYNHSFIGERLTRKWNFPESITEIIRSHHTPVKAKPEFREAVYTVYLADRIFYYKRGKCQYQELDPQVLHYFNLEHTENFEKMAKSLMASFLKNQG